MIAAMAGRLVSPITIGRRTELDAGLGALAAAADGAPSHLLVAGEAGVGKSRLAAELATIAEERGVLRPGDVSATAAAPTLSAQPAALTPLPLPSSNKVGLERLAELTQLYKADRISPYDYHHERAKIVATL